MNGQQRKRSFIQLSQAWYAEAAKLPGVDETFNINVAVGDTYQGEFEVTWYTNSPTGSAELRVLEDGWRALSLCQDLVVLVANAESRPLTPEMLREYLNTSGFEDATETSRPSV
ncbi:hypothetical protein [Pseudomonas baetica]|jgi:hypothetical protein|uniref:hypothetical protein n=2 Tax=Pseudomonas TaxID=286 RepID=UPI002407228A|nr:hypothetical protein [Pseudomonas baetica]MDF9778904.1 hypothetical protein [Pseudomonas baetica]